MDFLLVQFHFTMKQNINYKITKLFPKPLMILMSSTEVTKNSFKDYIKKKKDSLLTSDINIILEYLSQINFDDDELFTILRNDINFKEIIRCFEKKIIDKNGYYGIELENLKEIVQKQEILEQIRLRRLNEKIGNYQLALNHLVNEFQSIIFTLDNTSKAKKEYTANDIRKFLNNEDISRNDIIIIINMFDRRNNNLISHSGTEKDIYKYLTKEEYYIFKNTIKRILNELL